LAKKRRAKKKPPYLLFGLVGLFILGAVILLVWDTQQAQAPAGQLFTRTSDIERVSLVDSVEAFEADSAVFLDVRTTGEYEVSRIPGAVSIPVNQLPDRMDELNPDDWIITYCT
jgi:hypothetical protein